ncbi:MAG: DUF6798 domain-containing protein [Phycisphaerae bacterium]
MHNVMDRLRVADRDPAHAMSRGDVLVFSMLIGVLATLLDHYRLGHITTLVHIPLTLRELDPSYLANDSFINSRGFFGPRFYFTQMLAALCRLAPLSVVFLLLTCLAHVSTAFLTFVVARKLFAGSSLAAMIGCSLVMGVSSVMIGQSSHLHWGELNAQIVILPVALLSLWLGINVRPFACLLTAALASLIHPLLGSQCGAVGLATAGASILMGIDGAAAKEGRGQATSRHARWLRLSVVGAAGALLAAFIAVAWLIPTRTSSFSRDYVAIFARFRAPQHLIPSTFGLRHYAVFACFLSAWFVSWRWWYNDPATDRYLARRVLLTVPIVLALLLCGYVFVELIPTRFWTLSHIFRMVLVIKWLGLMLFGGTIARLALMPGRKGPPISAYLLLIGTGPAQPGFALLAHLWELARSRTWALMSHTAARVGAGVVLLGVIAALFRRGSLDETVALLCFASAAVWFTLVPRLWHRPVLPLLMLSVVVSFFWIHRTYRIPLLAPALDRYAPVVTLADHREDIDGVSAYARRHTEEDALFLVPPDLTGGRFRVMARRAPLVDFWSLPLAKEHLLQEWYRRIQFIYGPTALSGDAASDDLALRYRTVSQQHVQEVASRYGAAYAVLHTQTPCTWPVLFEQDGYKLVRIPDATSTTIARGAGTP